MRTSGFDDTPAWRVGPLAISRNYRQKLLVALYIVLIKHKGAQGFLSSVLQNEGYRFAKVRKAFFTRFALAVGAGYFGAVRHVPWVVVLDNRGKLVAHGSMLPPCLERGWADCRIRSGTI